VSGQSQGHGLGQWHVSRLAAPKSAHPGAKAALAEIYNAEDKDHALKAAKAFEADYGAQWTKATAKITEHLDVLLAFYDYPAEHWIHLRTTNPIESTLATVRLRQRIIKGPGRGGWRGHGVQAHRVSTGPVACGERSSPRCASSCRREVRRGQTRRATRRISR
jgi:hypothetical protein